MKERLVKKKPVVIIALSALVAALAGCTSGNQGATAPVQVKTEQPQSSGPLNITMTLGYDGKELPKPGNPVVTEIEKYTNTKLNITYIPGNEYGNKLPVILASGDLPKVITSFGPVTQPYLINAFLGGAFWEISPYVKDYPNLSKLNKLIYENVKVDGKIYGVPKTRPLARNVYIYRKDWLDGLGLKEPQTLDEFYNVLKAFTLNDPDKNGKNDTYGMTVFTATELPDVSFGVFFGAPYRWELRDGKFIRAEETPEHFEGLKFFKKLYDEKLVNQDFATVERAKYEGEFENSKAGIIANSTNTAIAYEARLLSHKPDAKINYFSILSGPKGKRIAGGTGSNGILMFPKSSVKTEAELKQILGFFDKLGDKPMADLLEWGLEGKHHQLKDGKPQFTNQGAYDEEVAYPYKWALRVVPTDTIKKPGIENPLNQREIEVTTDNEKYLVNDPTITLVSKTRQEKGAELDLLLKDAKVKYVMGKIDEAAYKKEVQKWKANGGDQIAAEFAEAYAKLNK